MPKHTTCQYGLDPKGCTRADAALSLLEKPALDCDDCRVSETAAEFLDNWYDLSDEDRSVARQWFARMGMGEIVALVNRKLPAPKQCGFVCPVIDAEIVTPCALKQCKFNLDYNWSNNCLLNYMHQQETQSLSLEEISYLYQMPLDRVTSVYKDSLVQLRSGAISIESEYDDTLQPSFAFFQSKHVCCVCESRIDGAVSQTLQVKSVGLAYCSKECKAEKPARLIELEAQYGLDIAQILKWVFANFRNLGLAEQALGIPRWLAYYTAKQFLGGELQNYFSSLRRIKETRKQKLVRRTWHKPTRVENMLHGMEPTRRLVFRKYGMPQMKSSSIIDDVDRVLNER